MRDVVELKQPLIEMWHNVIISAEEVMVSSALLCLLGLYLGFDEAERYPTTTVCFTRQLFNNNQFKSYPTCHRNVLRDWVLYVLKLTVGSWRQVCRGRDRIFHWGPRPNMSEGRERGDVLGEGQQPVHTS